MNEFRILTADDDPGMRLIMRKLIEKAEGYVHVGEAEDGDKLVEMYDELRPDVVFMDVEMPGKTGIECARYIQDKNPRTVIVFATAHEEYMKSAFEVYAFDYLVKPFKAERALNTFRLIRERLSQNAEPKPVKPPVLKPVTRRLMLKHKDGLSFLNLEEIVLVQREERTTVIYTSDGEKYITPDTLSEIDERLPDDMFFRSHKSYIVNLAHIESVSPYGRWTYVIKLAGMRLDALLTHERYADLQKMYE